MLANVRNAWRLFRKNFQEIRAEQRGEAISKARVVMQARHIPGLKDKVTATEAAPHDRAPLPIAGATIRMMDGDPMTFHTDGSLRHALGRRAHKAARKALKKQRHAARKASGVPMTAPASKPFGKIAQMLDRPPAPPENTRVKKGMA